MIRIVRLLAGLVVAPLVAGLGWGLLFGSVSIWGRSPILLEGRSPISLDKFVRAGFPMPEILIIVAIVAIVHTPIGLCAHLRKGGMVGWSAVWGALIGAACFHAYVGLTRHGQGMSDLPRVFALGALNGILLMVLAASVFSLIDGIPLWRRAPVASRPNG